MLEHHIQKQIIDSLVICQTARYSELKPKNIDSNTFTYHIQQLIRQRFIEKCDDGSYCLTARGKALGINSKLSKQDLLEQAHSILLMVVRNGDDWLLRRRLAQPVYGKFGFVHGEPQLGVSITDTARHIIREKTGIQAEFTPAGYGYITIMRGCELESFTHFTLLTGNASEGELIPRIGNGENAWLKNPDFMSADMIPSMADIVAALQGDLPFYLERTYQVD